MTISAANRIQSASGLVTASSFTATLPNPTQAGSTLLLFTGTSGIGQLIVQSQSFDPPWFQDQGHTGHWYAWRRDNQPAGESSWAITAAASAPYYWRAEEWGGLATISQPDVSSTITGVTSTLTVATDTSSTTISADVPDFAALAVFYASFAGASGWPAAHSYGAGLRSGPSSWNEVCYLVNGTGTASGDFILAVAEAYPGVTGGVACGLTFNTSGGGGTPAALDAWGVCYQPDMPAPATGVLAS